MKLLRADGLYVLFESMEIAIFLFAAAIASVLCIGGAIVFIGLADWASGTAIRGLCSLRGVQLEGDAESAPTFMKAEQSTAIVAESQRMLRESLQREAFNEQWKRDLR